MPIALAREAFGPDNTTKASPSDFIEVSTKHARQQLQAMSQQSRELAELAQKATIESMGPLATGLGGALLGRPDLS